MFTSYREEIRSLESVRGKGQTLEMEAFDVTSFTRSQPKTTPQQAHKFCSQEAPDHFQIIFSA